jgi:MEMO1 family protein
MAMRRTPALAEFFYPVQPQALETEVARLLSSRQEPQPVKAVVSPHTGIGYSGAVAGAVYGRIRCPAVFLMLGPNHLGVGEPVVLMAAGEWETPLDAVALERELVAAFCVAYPLVRDDPLAHAREHWVAMQLPFLQMLGEACGIVPLVLDVVPYEVYQQQEMSAAIWIR